MKSSSRTGIANPTIVEVFRQFLAEQQSRLSDRTYRRYEDVIILLGHSIDGYAYQCLDRVESALFRRHFDAEGTDHLEFTEIFGPDKILENVGEFLDDFMPRKVMAGKDLLRSAGTVTKKLARWLGERGHASTEIVWDAVDRGTEAARDLPAAHELCMLLDEYADGPGGLTATEEGYFEISRVEPGKIWVRNFGGPERGPIRLAPGVAECCPVGWTIAGMIGRRGRTWILAEAWNVYPGP